MDLLGKFWGVISVIFTLGALSRVVSLGFYNKFIKGLSKKKHRGIINKTININNVLEENHGVFGVGAFISSIIHMLIMNYKESFSFWGIATFVCVLIMVATGIINKFIYRDKRGQIRKFHTTIILIYIVSLVMHIIFTK
ncbi:MULTISPECIES: hypothetical protein [unclassified Clostridium]|uniref:hypothetical protein n=1 Tax=unclassified Clostridium TaxID=2614128 RepID=UPI003216D6A9